MDHSIANNGIVTIKGYHAHVYYDAKTRRLAESIRSNLGLSFKGAVKLGRWHDKCVGPHTQSMYQVAFERTLFSEIVPWLLLNRLGLSILVHPNCGNALADHTKHAVWMGKKLEIDLSKFASSDCYGSNLLNTLQKLN